MPESVVRLDKALADRYVIDRKLGEGGMATVYLAEDVRHHRQVAIKVLKPELAAVIGPERFFREIEIAARLRHPHILPLYDSGDADGFLYYVMPYVEGDSLRQRLNREKQLPLNDALRIVGVVADALDSAHTHNVVHRDIKPENILLEEKHAVVADFGIARAISEAGGDKLTETGLAVGTPAYMSPEQASGDPNIDGRSDIYSLACVLYEMLGGEPPHTGPTPQAILARQLTGEVRSLIPLRTSVSPALDRVIRTALSPAAADRYVSAHQFTQALSTAAAEPIPERTTATEISSAATPGTPLSAGARAKTRGRRVAFATAVGATVLVVGFLVLSGRPPSLGAVEADRILILPFATTGSETATAAEEAFTAILHGLDGAGGLRTVDGWNLLEERERETPRTIPTERIRSIATSRRAAFALTGRLAARGNDSVEMFVSVIDVRGDSTFVRSNASGARNQAWRAGFDAVNQLLPTLVGDVPTGRGVFAERHPAAVASFLLGEAAFRRARAQEALLHYQAAVAADSAFGLAAIRGAQAAAWAHDERAGDVLLDLAMGTPLSERDVALARGMRSYLHGDADRAVDELNQALDRDLQLAFAWQQLGEVYTHLVVRRGRQDTLAESAFRRVQALDPGAEHVLFHLLEARYRRGEWQGAVDQRRRFLAAEPDDRLASEIQIVSQCVEGGPDSIEWNAWMSDPVGVSVVGHMLASGGAHQLTCANAAFWAVLTRDPLPDPTGGKKWSGVKGVFAVLAAQGRGEALERFLDSLVADGYTAADRLYAPAAILNVLSPDKADSVARIRSARYPEPTAGQAWYAGTWAAHRGDTATLELMVSSADRAASAFEARADTLTRTGSADAASVNDEARHARLLADALVAHLTLLRGDTAEAIRRFRDVRPNAGRLSNRSLAWHLLEPLPLEQWKLAELLLATGRPAEAFEIAGAFDAPAPIAFVPFVPASLELRIRAAEALGRSDLVPPLRRRLEGLREGGLRQVVSGK